MNEIFQQKIKMVGIKRQKTTIKKLTKAETKLSQLSICHLGPSLGDAVPD